MAVTAFHAVNSGSNPLGDANRKLKAHHIISKNRGLVVRLLYYKHPPLVKPLPKAQKPCRPLQALCCLAPSGAFFLRVESLKIPLPREETTERKAVVQALVIAGLCICGLASPLPPFSIQKGGQL